MPLACRVEVSEHLVGSPAFKAGGTGDPRPAGSIPVHLRHRPLRQGDAQAGTPGNHGVGDRGSDQAPKVRRTMAMIASMSSSVAVSTGLNWRTRGS